MAAREVKVGAFVLAGLCVLALVIFLIGEERRVFASKEAYYAVFQDVEGLRRGSPVRMGGVDIGSVSEVAYGENANDARIYVRMAIVTEEARRIREDSVAMIESKGLLGDKMITISVGSSNKPALPPGSEIRSRSGNDLSQMMSRLGIISGHVERVVGNLERTTESLAEPGLHDDLKQGIASLSRILASVDRGEGYVGKLFRDPEEAERLSHTVANLERASANLAGATQGINQMLARVQEGPGLLHEVIYGEEGSRALAQFGGAAEEIEKTLQGIRDGDGLARSVLYGGPEGRALVENLTRASADLQAITAGLRSGKGTLGALLVDPSVYEDLKLVLGNVERNRALRALVRYSIRRDGPAPRVEDPDRATAAEGAEGALEGAAGPKVRAE